MRRERGVMHFVYIACLLEMQGRKNMAGHDVTGQGRAGRNMESSVLIL